MQSEPPLKHCLTVFGKPFLSAKLIKQWKLQDFDQLFRPLNRSHQAVISTSAHRFPRYSFFFFFIVFFMYFFFLILFTVFYLSSICQVKILLKAVNAQCLPQSSSEDSFSSWSLKARAMRLCPDASNSLMTLFTSTFMLQRICNSARPVNLSWWLVGCIGVLCNFNS